MKKWLIVAAGVIVLWAMGTLTWYLLDKDNATKKAVQNLEREIKILKVIAEHRELQVKIKQCEKQLGIKSSPKPAIIPDKQ